MVVKQDTETKTFLIWETETHRFKINEDTLEDLKSKKNFLELMRRRVQRDMRQIVDNSTGEYWEQSFKEIYSTITGQGVLPNINRG